MPEDSWEMVDMLEQQPAVETTRFKAEGEEYVIRVEAEATVVARNTKYRNEMGEPPCYAYWVYKPFWKREAHD